MQSRGSTNENVAPLPGALSTHSRPPKCWMIWRQIGRPEPVPLRFLGQGIADLAEFFEYHALVFRADADAVVRDVDAQAVGDQRAAHDDPAAGVGAEFGRIGQQVQHHLHQAVAVGDDGRQVLGNFELERNGLVREQLAGRRTAHPR